MNFTTLSWSQTFYKSIEDLKSPEMLPSSNDYLTTSLMVIGTAVIILAVILMCYNCIHAAYHSVDTDEESSIAYTSSSSSLPVLSNARSGTRLGLYTNIYRFRSITSIPQMPNQYPCYQK